MKSTTTAGAIHAALTRNLRREHGFEPMEVEGTLPPDLEGTLYRVGPGLFERFGRRVNHPFEADGAMSAVRIADGQAKGAVRVVRGRGFQEEERAGRHLYSSRARLVDRLSNLALGEALPAASRTAVFNAVSSITQNNSGSAYLTTRVKQAAFLVLASPQYQMTR